MTKIKIYKNRITFDGHAGNHDVCTAISIASQMVGNYIEASGKGEISIGDGHYSIIAQDMDNDLFHALKMALSDIESQYPDNVCIEEVKDESG